MTSVALDVSDPLHDAVSVSSQESFFVRESSPLTKPRMLESVRTALRVCRYRQDGRRLRRLDPKVRPRGEHHPAEKEGSQ